MKKEVPGYDGKYWAGEDGHIYRRSRKGLIRVAEYIWDDGYPFIHASFAGKRKSVRVHLLILAAFHGERPSPAHVSRHLDGSRNNNRPDNLAWGTQRENIQDSIRLGVWSHGEKACKAVLTDEIVLSLRENAPYSSEQLQALGDQYGVHCEHIRAVVNGRFWRHLPGGLLHGSKTSKGQDGGLGTRPCR